MSQLAATYHQASQEYKMPWMKIASEILYDETDSAGPLHALERFRRGQNAPKQSSCVVWYNSGHSYCI